MAATFEFYEDNGNPTGTPPKGTYRNPTAQVNWKSADNINGAYTAAPINAGENSMSKYQFGKFTGTFNSISNVLFAHTAGALPTNTKLMGTVTSQYQKPTQAAVAGLTDMSAVTSIAAGKPVKLSTAGPEGANPTNTITSAGYTQYLLTQIQTTPAALPGDSPSITLTLRYSEN